MHGNRSKQPANTLDKSISDNIILLYLNKYQDFNFNHFYDYLIEEENIIVSYHSVYTILTSHGIISPKARRATKRKAVKEKLLKENKLKNIKR